jgi:hypothetical protein
MSVKGKCKHLVYLENRCLLTDDSCVGKEICENYEEEEN